MSLAENVRTALKRERLKRKMSQEEFGYFLGLSQSYISEVETGKKTPPLDLLIEIADALDLDIYDLLFPDYVKPEIREVIKLLIKG